MLDRLRKLPVRFLFTALLYLLAAATLGLLMLIGVVYFRAAHVHLALIGFVSLTIMGSMYQIVPTLLGSNLRLTVVAEVQFWLANIGVLGMFRAFTGSYSLLSSFGAVFLLSAYLFAAVIFYTIFSAKGEKKSLALWFFSAAILYLLAGSTLGMLNVLGIIYFPISAHAHLNVVGWVAMTTMGGLYELMPMLSLRKLYSRRLGIYQFWLANLGVVGMVVSFLYFSLVLLLASGFIFTLAFYLFGFNMYKTYFSKAESREMEMAEERDISAIFFAYALPYGIVGVTLGLLASFLGLRLVFTQVHLLLAGWVTITIIGAMYHIIPMLVWMEKYSDKLGVEKVPMIKDMYSSTTAKTLLYSTNIGVIGLAAFASFKYVPSVSGGLLLLSFYVFFFEMVRVLRV